MTTVTVDAALNKRVYVVDDDEPVRRSLCALLTAHKLDPIACESAELFIARFEPELALCAFVDLRMQGMSGMDLQRFLGEKRLTLPTIILTAHGDVPLAVEAMKRGAIDFIEKPASEAQLLGAIHAARSHLAKRPQPTIGHGIVSARLARLTGREKEVLDNLILGMTNKDIAEQLGISQRTVEIHRSRVREKLEARGLADLIRMTRSCD